MTRATSNFIWAIALIVGAFVLAKKDEGAVPWAIGLTAAIVGGCALIGMLAERDKI